MRLLLAGLLMLGVVGCGPKIPGAVWYDSLELICDSHDCPRCYGRRAYACPPCGGLGELPCDSCDDGTQECGECHGDGSDDGKVCDRCDGSGRQTCWSCGGDQMETCDTCDGETKVMCTRKMPVPMPNITDPQDAWPPGNFEKKD